MKPTHLDVVIQLLATHEGITKTSDFCRRLREMGLEKTDPRTVRRSKARILARTGESYIGPSGPRAVVSDVGPVSPTPRVRARANSNPFGVSSYEDSNIKTTPVSPSKKSRAKPKTMVRDDWRPEANQIKNLCAKFNLTENQLIEFIDEEFKPGCRAKDLKYADHAAAVRTWLQRRKNNGGIRKQQRSIQEELEYVRSLNLQ